jgi:hypothetical protein
MTKSGYANCSPKSCATRATTSCSPKMPPRRGGARGRPPRPGPARHLDARYRWHHAAQGMVRQRPAQHAGGDDVGPRHDRHRGRGDPDRRAGLPGKADRHAKAAGGGEESARAWRAPWRRRPFAGRLCPSRPLARPQAPARPGAGQEPAAAAALGAGRHRRAGGALGAGRRQALDRPGARLQSAQRRDAAARHRVACCGARNWRA